MTLTTAKKPSVSSRLQGSRFLKPREGESERFLENLDEEK
jgi:hypothetical protein